MATTYEVEPVGFVESPREVLEDDYWGEMASCITLADGTPAEALQGLTAFSHVEVLFLFHRVEVGQIVHGVRRPRNNPDWPEVGIFAQRGKNRPNRIGSTICRVVRVDGARLYVAELDAVAGTPVLDLKPVMSAFLPRGSVREPAWAEEIMRVYWARADEGA